MRTVAERCHTCLFATAEPELFCGIGLIFHGRKRCGLVGAIAKRLRLAVAACAPPVGLACFDIDSIRAASGDGGSVH